LTSPLGTTLSAPRTWPSTVALAAAKKIEGVWSLKCRLQALPRGGEIESGGCSEASCHSSGCKSHQQRSPVTVVVISSSGEGDQTAESLDVKGAVGWETGQIRLGAEQPGRP